MTVVSHVTVISRGESRINEDEEYFYCDDQLHREDGPAIIKHQYFPFGTTEEHYYHHGKLDREDGPAIIKYNADLRTREEYYYRDGKLDRKDGPAVVKRNADGSTEEEYYRDGKLFRKNGPQVVKRYADGTTEEQYYENGVDGRPGPMHRFDGPAFVTHNPWDGSKKEGYFYGGMPRDLKFGPAFIKHNADGSTVKEYCRYGVTAKTEYLNSDGVVVKTEGLTPGKQVGHTYEVSLAEDKGLTRKRAALKAAGPNHYAELKKATPQSVTASTPRAPQQKWRAPAPA